MFYVLCNFKITNYEYVTNFGASLSRILHWLIHVVDNFNVKTNLLCNESMFQQTYMVKTQMHFLYVRTGEFPTLGIISSSSKSDIKPIDYACKFVLD